MRMGFGSNLTLTEEDAAAMAAQVPGVVNAGGVMRGTAQIVFGNQNWSTQIQGVTADYGDTRDWDVAVGKFFSPEDVDAATKVAVLGQTVKESLFSDGEAVGQIIRIKKVPFTVVGVLDRKGQSTWGQDQDDVVLIPLSTAKKRVLGVSQANARSVGVIQIKVASADAMADVEQQVNELLRQRHRLQPYQDNDFQVRNLTDMFATQEAASRTMTLLLAAIASVSLLVGGIGIMNIMLVSVTERTREIGIRMALGARRRRILGQFIVEAAALSSVGGVLGVLIGAGLAVGARELYQIPASIPLWAVLLSLAAASGCGLLFGIYPAARASRLDPVEAMRTE
jgi:putative ABC transport system permease protein